LPNSDQLKIISPILIEIPRKTKPARKVYLNLNNYRNLNFIVNNQAKHIYSEALQCVLSGLKLKTPIELHYTYFKGSNRKSDKMNVLSIVDKFFCDSLVNYSCIPDDNDEYIGTQTFSFGGLDKNNPRVEILIKQQL